MLASVAYILFGLTSSIVLSTCVLQAPLSVYVFSSFEFSVSTTLPGSVMVELFSRNSSQSFTAVSSGSDLVFTASIATAGLSAFYYSCGNFSFQGLEVSLNVLELSDQSLASQEASDKGIHFENRELAGVLLNPSFSVSPISNYYPFDLTVEVTGSNFYYLTASLSLTANPSGMLRGTLTTTLSNAIGTLYNIYFTKSGLYTITYHLVGSMSTSINQEIYVSKSQLIMTFPGGFPPRSFESFQLLVEYRDFTGELLPKVSDTLYFNIQLVASQSGNSGTIMINNPPERLGISTVAYSFNELRILSSGTFKIQAISYDDLASAESLEFTILNKVKSFTLATDPMPSPSNYFSFTLQFNLIGDDDNPYVLPAEIQINSYGAPVVTGSIGTYTPVNGLVTITNISLLRADQVQLEAVITNGVSSGSFPIIILKSKLKLTLSQTPSVSVDFFNVEVSLMDNSGTYIETNNGPYSIKIVLNEVSDNSGTLMFGDTTVNTSMGIATFQDLLVYSSGYFKITSEYDFVDSASSDVFHISNYVDWITLTLDLEKSVIVIHLYGDDANDYLLPVTVWLIFDPPVTVEPVSLQNGYDYSFNLPLGLHLNYIVEASCDKIGPVYFESDKIELNLYSDPIIEIIAVPSVVSVSNYFPFDLSIEIRGPDAPSFYSALVTLSMVSSGSMYGSLSGTLVSGKKNLNIYFTLSGINTIKISISLNNQKFEKTQDIVVSKSQLFMTFPSGFPPPSFEPFKLLVEYRDNEGVLLPSISDNRVYFYIQLMPSQPGNSGTLMINNPPEHLPISTVAYSFNELRILSSGTFKIQAISYDDLASAESLEFTILNKVKFFRLATNPMPSPSNYFSFTLQFNLIGDDDNPYVLPAEIQINSYGAPVVTGSIGTYTPVNGLVTITNISLLRADQVQLEAVITNGVSSGSFPIVILKSKLKMTLLQTVIFNQPSLSSDVFTVEVSIFDNSETYIETNNGPYSITLVLSEVSQNSGGSINGVTAVNTIMGIAKFQDISVYSSGRFKFTCNYDFVDSASSDEFSIINYVKWIKLTAQPSSPTQKSVIVIHLYGDDSNNYLLPVEVSLILNPSVALNSVSLQNGNDYSFELPSGLYLPYTVEASCNKQSTINFKSDKIDLAISKATLVMTATPYPTALDTEFQIQAKILDTATNNYFVPSDAIEINLSVTCLSCISPQLDSFYSLNAGSLTISGLLFVQAGTCQITASNPYFNSEAITLTVLDTVVSVEMSVLHKEISINTYFSVTIALFAKNHQPYFGECNLIVVDDYEVILTTTVVHGPIEDIDVYLPTLDVTLLQASCNGINATVFDIIALPLTLRIIPDQIPLHTNEYFYVTVGIFNSFENPEDSLIANYSVSLTLAYTSVTNNKLFVLDYNNNVNETGIFAKNINIGFMKEFQELNIYSAGSFILTASSSYSQSIINATLEFSLEDSISQATLVGPSAVQAYEINEIIVTIYGGDGQLLLQEAAVHLEADGFFVQQNPIFTNTGKAVFKVFADDIIRVEYGTSVEFNGIYSYSNPFSLVADVSPADFVLNFNDSGIYLNEPFSINVTIINLKGERLFNADGFQITLSSSDNYFPSITSIVNQGQTNFSGLVFNIKGGFSLYLGSDLLTINPKEVVVLVTERLAYMQCFISSTTTSTYFSEILTILLQDTKSNIYNEDFTVKIQCWNNTENCLAYSQDQGDDTKFFVYFKTTGLNFMEIRVNSNGVTLSQVLKIHVQRSILKFEDITLENFDVSTTGFSVVVAVYDSSGQIIETMNGPYLITVMLVVVTDVPFSGSKLKGDANQLTDLGVATFNDLSILSTGFFRIKASSVYFGEIQSEISYYISNRPYDYQITSSRTSVTVYENITLQFNIVGDDEQPFILPTILTFNDISDDIFGLSDPVESKSGIFIVSFYCTLPQTLQLTGEFTSKNNELTTDLITLNITNANFSVTFDKLAQNINENFTITVHIINSLNNVIKNFPVLEFTVFLNTIDFASTEFISDSLINGQKTFPDLVISMASTYFFTIIPESLIINIFTGDNFSITTPVHNIVLSSVDTVSTYQIFTISISLFDENDEYYYGDINVTLSEVSLSLSGNLSQNLSDGYKEASFWFNSDGEKKITVTSNNSASYTVTTILSITVYQSNIILNNPYDYIGVRTADDISHTLKIMDKFFQQECLAEVKGALRLYLVVFNNTVPNTGLRFYPSKPIYFSGVEKEIVIKIYSTGSFILCISGYSLVTGCTNEIYVISSFKKATVIFNNTSPTVYDTVNVVINFWGVRNYHYNAYGINFGLSSSMAEDITGLKLLYTENGISSLNLQFTKAQSYDLYINLEFYYTDIYYINATQPVLEIMLTEAPLSFSTVFMVYVKARNQKLMSDIPVQLQLICKPNSICSGTSFNRLITPVKTYRGIAKFKDLQIFSSGSFYLRATAPQYLDVDANIPDLVNEVKKVDFGQPLYDPTLNFKIVYNCCLIGLDDRPYILPTKVFLSEGNGYLFNGISEIDVLNGNFTIELQFLELVLYNFTLTLIGSNYTENLLFNVQKLNLYFMNPPKFKYQLGETVFIKAAVYDHTGTQLETEGGNYTFIIDVSPSGGFNRTEMTTFQGIRDISFEFKYPGLYIISAQPQDNFIIYPTLPILVTDSATTILFNAKDLNQTTNTLFTFNITLLNYYGDPFNYNNSVVFFCADGSGKTVDGLAIPTNSSNSSLLLYFLSGGKKECSIVASNSTFVELEFIVDPVKINQDEKCEITVNNKTCFKCFPQAILINGTCSCVESSYFNPLTQSCECETGLVFNNSACSICANYYSSDEISAYFSQDYKSITVLFLRPVDQKIIKNCNSSVLLPKSLSKYSFICFLTDLFTLVIDFNAVIPTDEPVISLNPKIVQASGSICVFNMKDLKLTVNIIYEKPVPLASIIGPSSVSLGCNIESFIFTSKHTSADYVYKWSTKQISGNINQFLAAQTLETVTIPSNILTEGSLIITLTITSLLFNTTNSDQFNLAITSRSSLTVMIAEGSSKTINRQDALQLKALILDNCNKPSNYNYQWTYSSSPNDKLFSFNSMTNKDQNLIYLSIYPYSLHKGIMYSFSVFASSSSMTGLASINITVVSSELNIHLSRSSGTVGTYQDLIIEATIVDSDNECSPNSIISVWSCTTVDGQCLDSAEKPLIQDSGQRVLTIGKERLKNLELYHFQIKATCSFKVNSTITTIDLRIDNTTIGDISIASINPITSSDAITVIPLITAFIGAKFLWTIYPSIKGLILDQPYLYIPSNTLEPANAYLLTLSMYRKHISDGVNGYTNLQVKENPKCKNLEIIGVKNNFFKFTALGCQNDNQLGTIMYSYGYYKEDEIVWATKQTLENPMKIFISDNPVIGVAKVCYNSNACNIIDSAFPKKQSRRLEMDLSDYEAYAYDPDYVPSLLMYYSNLVNSQSDFDFLYKKYIEHYGNTELPESSLDVFLDSTIAMINNSFALVNITNSQLGFSTELLKRVLQGRTAMLTNAQINKILRILTINIVQRTSDSINEILELMSITNSLNTPLNFEIYSETDKIGFFRYKNKALEFFNRTIVLKDIIIQIRNLTLHNDTIYDLFLSKCLQDTFNFKLSFYESGKYKLFNYFPQKPKPLANNSLETPISITIYGNFSEYNLYTCLIYTKSGWIAKGCKIIKNNSTSLEIDLMNFSSFKIIIDDECHFGMGPIIAMGALLFLIVVMYPVLWNSDHKVKNDSDANAFLLYYPMTSLFFKQPDNRRSIIVLQLLVSQLLMLTLIGGAHFYFDSTRKVTTNSFDTYSYTQLYKGSIGYGLSQLLAFPMFIFNILFIKRKAYIMIMIPALIIIVIGCVIGVMILNGHFCEGWSAYWISNFSIFLLFDILVIQIAYAAILSVFIKRSMHTYVGRFDNTGNSDATVPTGNIIPKSLENENIRISIPSGEAVLSENNRLCNIEEEGNSEEFDHIRVPNIEDSKSNDISELYLS